MDVIDTYSNRFFTEISNAHYAVDRLIFDYFKSEVIEDKINIHTDKRLDTELVKHITKNGEYKTEYDMYKKSINIIPSMRFIYEMSCTEAFLTDYIEEKYGEKKEEIKKEVHRKRDKFNNKNSSINLNKSRSYLNLNFVQFLLKELFNKNLKLSELQKEFGALRNCLIHSNGITREKDLPLLKNTLKELHLKNEVGEKIVLDQFSSNSFFGFLASIIGTLKS